MSRELLVQRQAALVAALVAGAPLPPGFDQPSVRAAADALMRKRAGEVANVWPALCALLGPQWNVSFAAWAARRPPPGALRDGWDFARSIAATGGLGRAAAVELAEREVAWRYDGVAPPRRRLAGARRVPGGLLLQVAGRVWRSVRLGGNSLGRYSS